MDHTPSIIEKITAETGKTGDALAEEMVARGAAPNVSTALLIIDVEAGGPGDCVNLDKYPEEAA